MQAIVYRHYGDPRHVFQLEDVPTPTPGPGEVLVRVRAAAANPLDCFIRGVPYVGRLMTGCRRPKPTTPGVDVSGEVEAVGPGVTRFGPGDAVFGVARGSFAEYTCAREVSLALKPAALSFAQAAAIPVAGVTALQAVRDKGRLQHGQRVLVIGAAGGVGSFAVQVAKAYGAHVTGVCGQTNMDVVRSIGADRVIGYTSEDFTLDAGAYDVVIDCAGRRPLLATRRVLKPGGCHVAVGMPIGSALGLIRRLLGMLALSLVGKRVTFFIAKMNVTDLATLADLAATGKISPVVGATVPLADAAAAILHIEGGHARGKAVVAVA